MCHVHLLSRCIFALNSSQIADVFVALDLRWFQQVAQFIIFALNSSQIADAFVALDLRWFQQVVPAGGTIYPSFTIASDTLLAFLITAPCNYKTLGIILAHIPSVPSNSPFSYHVCGPNAQ